MKHWAAGPPLIVRCWPGMARARSPWVITNRSLGSRDRVTGHVAVKTVPGKRVVTWDRTPLGLETALSARPRAALAVEGIGKTLELPNLEVRRCTGRLNATQPEVQPSALLTYVDWLPLAREASPAGNTRRYSRGLKAPINPAVLLRLRGCSEARIVGEPHKSKVLLGCALVMRRSIAAFPARPCRLPRTPRPALRPIFRSPPTPGSPATESRPASSWTSTGRSISRLHAGRSLSRGRRHAAGQLPACPPAPASAGRGLIKAFRYGLVMQGGSRIVFDLTGPAKIEKAFVLDAANGQPARLVLDLAAVDRDRLRAVARRGKPRRAAGRRSPTQLPRRHPTTRGHHAKAAAPPDPRPLVVIDPGHGGIDNGTQAERRDREGHRARFRAGAARRSRRAGKYRVVMTRTDDTFIPLGERVRMARSQQAALFVSIHADALPRGEGDAQGATIYTLSETASDAEAARLAEAENKADVIAGVDLTAEPDDVADILIDLAQRETKTFSNHFARLLVGEMKTYRAAAQASAEVGGLPGAEGAGRALGADRTRLRVEQGRPRSS